MTAPKFRLDGTFTYGNLFTVISLLVSVVAMAVMFNSRLGTVEGTLAEHEEAIGVLQTNVSGLAPVIAVDQQRLNAIEAFNERTANTIERIDDRLLEIQLDVSALRAADEPLRQP